MSTFDQALEAALRISSPLLLAGLGEVIIERAGILNIGMEGVMLTGAFAAFAASFATHSPVVGAACAALAGALLMALFALLVLRYKADPIVTGMAINLIAMGLTGTAYMALGAAHPGVVLEAARFEALAPGLNIPLLSSLLFSQSVLTAVGLALVPLLWFYFARSERGLELRAVGENPAAAEASGVNVLRARWKACLAAGCLGGLGGAFLTISQTGSFAANCTGGRGFIVLAAVVIGRYAPVRTALACVLFGAAFYVRDAIPPGMLATDLVELLPYVLTLATLAFRNARSAAPAGLGKPW